MILSEDARDAIKNVIDGYRDAAEGYRLLGSRLDNIKAQELEARAIALEDELTALVVPKRPSNYPSDYPKRRI